MDFLTFISSLIDSLAWPVCLFIIVVIFKEPILDLLTTIRSFRVGMFKLDLTEDKESIRLNRTSKDGELTALLPRLRRRKEQLRELATVSPRAAVIAAWQELKVATVDRARSLELRPATTIAGLGAQLERVEALPSGVGAILRKLSSIRNQVAHQRFIIPEEKAREFIDTAVEVLALLEDNGPAPSSIIEGEAHRTHKPSTDS